MVTVRPFARAAAHRLADMLLRPTRRRAVLHADFLVLDQLHDSEGRAGTKRGLPAASRPILIG